MSFSKDYVNKVVYPKGTTVNVRAYPVASDKAVYSGKTVDNLLEVVKAGNPVGRTSGTFYKMNDGDWYQIMFYSPVKNRTYGYCRIDVIKFEATTTNTQGEKNGNSLLQDLIASDISLYQNLLISQELITQLKAKGTNVTIYERVQNDLIKKYNERQTAIKSSNLVKTQNWLNNKWEWLQKKWSALVSGPPEEKVGIAPLILVAIGGAVGLVTAVLLYYAFKPKYDDAKVDLKDSAELTKALSSLTPEESKKLTDNLEKQIDDAYNQGKKDQSFSGAWSTIKNVGIFVLAFWAADKFVFSKRSN